MKPKSGISLSASGRAVDGQQPGSFKVELAVSDRRATADEDAVSLANGRIDFEASSLPLKLLEPVVRRWLGSAELEFVQCIERNRVSQ